jgi:hypothetical protein
MRSRSKYPDHSGRSIVSPQRRHSLWYRGLQSESSIRGNAETRSVTKPSRATCLTFGSQARVVLRGSVNDELNGLRLRLFSTRSNWLSKVQLSLRPAFLPRLSSGFIDQEIVEFLSFLDGCNKPTRSCSTSRPGFARGSSIFRGDRSAFQSARSCLAPRFSGAPLHRPSSPIVFASRRDAQATFRQPGSRNITAISRLKAGTAIGKGFSLFLLTWEVAACSGSSARWVAGSDKRENPSKGAPAIAITKPPRRCRSGS